MIKQLRRALTRQIANKIAYVIIGLVMAIVPVLIGNFAGAASAMDSNYRTKEKLEIGLQGYGGTYCDLIDITSDWYTRSLDALEVGGEGDAWKQALQTAVNNNGRWIVTQNIDHFQDNPAYAYIITFTEDDSLSLHFDGESVVATGNNLYSVLLRTVPHQNGIGDCNELVSITTMNSYSSVSNAENFGPSRNQFLVHYLNINEQNVVYPPDYEGVPITNTPDPTGGDNVIHPTVSATVSDKSVIYKIDPLPFKPCSVNYMVSYSEKNNTDFGDVPKTLIDGWKLIFSGDITLEEWRKSSEASYDARTIDFKYKVSPDAEQTIQAPAEGSLLILVDVNTEWEGAPRQSCGDNGNPDDFDYEIVPRVQFININGSSYIIDGTKCDPNSNICDTTTAKSDLYDCFTDTFPFFSLPSCVEAIQVLTTRLSFNQIEFGNAWVFNPQCRTLGTLGDWIGADSKIICPYFPSHVRNLIDPFVLFVLSLLVVTFIARQTGKDF